SQMYSLSSSANTPVLMGAALAGSSSTCCPPGNAGGAGPVELPQEAQARPSKAARPTLHQFPAREAVSPPMIGSLAFGSRSMKSDRFIETHAGQASLSAQRLRWIHVSS